MPGEAILVVDDAPVNLKLADLVLRKEGFRVHAVPNAEEALRVLRNVHPKLMLVDIRLPGMDGLELTRRVKDDARTRDMVVVALTACAMRGDEDRALEAGCDGYITKPIDTQTFGRRIRAFLERRPIEDPAAAASPAEQHYRLPSGVELGILELESLRRRFLEEGILQSRQMLLDLGAQFDMERAGALLHRWIGAGEALGYSTIAEHTRETESVLQGTPLDARALRERLSELVLAFHEPREAALDPLPEGMLGEIAGKRIGLVGFTAEDAERLCAVLEQVGARPRLFDAGESPEAEGVRHCQAVLVSARGESMRGPWLSASAALPAGSALVIVGRRDRVMALDPALQAQAHEFLIDGWQPEEAVMRLVFALGRAAAVQPAAAGNAAPPPVLHGKAGALERGGVLLAASDAGAAALLQSAFRDQNIGCRVVSTGAEALRIIREAQPAAAVLDVNLPAMSGLEVLASIKVSSLPARVILLTGHGCDSEILQGFRLGADDCVSKPCQPMEVVLRMKRLFGRS